MGLATIAYAMQRAGLRSVVLNTIVCRSAACSGD